MRTTTNILAAGLAAASLAGTAFASGQPPIGETAPDFTLTDSAGVKHSLTDYKGKYVVLEWTNPGCPFVKKALRERQHGETPSRVHQEGRHLADHRFFRARGTGISSTAKTPRRPSRSSTKTRPSCCWTRPARSGMSIMRQIPRTCTSSRPKASWSTKVPSTASPPRINRDISKATNYVKENLDAVMDGQTGGRRGDQSVWLQRQVSGHRRLTLMPIRALLVGVSDVEHLRLGKGGP